MFFVPDQPSKLLNVVGDDPIIKGLSLLHLWKKPVTLGPESVISIEDISPVYIRSRSFAPLPDICPFVTCPPDISPLPYSKSGHLPPVHFKKCFFNLFFYF